MCSLSTTRHTQSSAPWPVARTKRFWCASERRSSGRSVSAEQRVVNRDARFFTNVRCNGSADAIHQLLQSLERRFQRFPTFGVVLRRGRVKTTQHSTERAPSSPFPAALPTERRLRFQLRWTPLVRLAAAGRALRSLGRAQSRVQCLPTSRCKNARRVSAWCTARTAAVLFEMLKCNNAVALGNFVQNLGHSQPHARLEKRVTTNSAPKIGTRARARRTSSSYNRRLQWAYKLSTNA